MDRSAVEGEAGPCLGKPAAQPDRRADGELSAETLHRKGVLGAVLDGGLRDASFILRLGFRCWRTFHTPRDVVGMWRPTGVDVPIIIGGVLVRPGDWLHGDRDGMVVIPVEILDEVIAKAVAAMQTESLVRKAILEGSIRKRPICGTGSSRMRIAALDIAPVAPPGRGSA